MQNRIIGELVHHPENLITHHMKCVRDLAWQSFKLQSIQSRVNYIMKLQTEALAQPVDLDEDPYDLICMRKCLQLGIKHA